MTREKFHRAVFDGSKSVLAGVPAELRVFLIELLAPRLISRKNTVTDIKNVFYAFYYIAFIYKFLPLVTNFGPQPAANWAIALIALLVTNAQRSEDIRLRQHIDETIRQPNRRQRFNVTRMVYNEMRTGLRCYLLGAGLLLIIWPLVNALFWCLPWYHVFLLYGFHLLLFLSTLYGYCSLYAKPPSDGVIIAYMKAMNINRRSETSPDENV